MASDDTVKTVVRHILTAYPKERAKLGADEIRSMFEVWPQYLNDLDDTLLLAAVQEHITHSQWLPSIAEIRAAAVSLMRQASPARQSAIDAWGDVMTFPAAAIKGEGVRETFRELMRQLYRSMGQHHSFGEKFGVSEEDFLKGVFKNFT